MNRSYKGKSLKLFFAENFWNIFEIFEICGIFEIFELFKFLKIFEFLDLVRNDGERFDR